MYYCYDCEMEFKEPDVETKRYPDSPPEDTSTCPFCGSENIEPLIPCRCCNNDFLPEELNKKGICSECWEDGARL